MIQVPKLIPSPPSVLPLISSSRAVTNRASILGAAALEPARAALVISRAGSADGGITARLDQRLVRAGARCARAGVILAASLEAVGALLVGAPAALYVIRVIPSVNDRVVGASAG